jgi:AraC-like DNA-binding protein
MLLHSPAGPSLHNADFCRGFHSKWGHENCIILRRARTAEFGPHLHSLSIRAAWGGAEHCHVNGRTIAVDDDNYLVLNHGRLYSTSICALLPVETLAICFRPELVQRTYGAMAASVEQALSVGDGVLELTAEFSENLQQHDQRVSPVLRYIKSHLLQGLQDEAWYEEQLILLLERMLADRERMLEHVDRLRLTRVATRREVYRRICLATDFLHTNYAEELSLDSIAKVACLSKYHFLRLFALVHGVTPLTYLQRKRTCVAVRLLQSTQLTMGEIAWRVGFAAGLTLLRQTRRWTGLTPTQIRAEGRHGERSVAFSERQLGARLVGPQAQRRSRLREQRSIGGCGDVGQHRDEVIAVTVSSTAKSSSCLLHRSDAGPGLLRHCEGIGCLCVRCVT